MDSATLAKVESKLVALKKRLHTIPQAEKTQLLDLITELDQRVRVSRAKQHLLDFIKFVDPDYKIGAHHKKLAALLEDLAFGRRDRIAVNIAPRFGKSLMVSQYFPAWFLGLFPSMKVMMVSHTADLAVDFGRKVRNLITSEPYQAIFSGNDGVALSQDSKSAGRWHTNKGGEYFAVGVGGAIAGRGADLLLVDDPHNEQDIINGNLDVFDKAYEWFTTGARTRLMPGGRVAIVQCMTGDTPVLMADSTEKPLRDIRPGDLVASYDKGQLVASKVLNWANQGIDRVYTITMDNGNLITGNERHPFLVSIGGVTQWIRLHNLKPGMSLVVTKDAAGPLITKLHRGYARFATTVSGGAREKLDGLLSRWRSASTNVSLKGVKESPDQPHAPVYAPHARRERGITRSTLMQSACHWATTVNGKARLALHRGVVRMRELKDIVLPAITSSSNSAARSWGSLTIPTNGAGSISEPGMVLLRRNMQGCLSPSMGGALYVDLSQQRVIPPPVGSTTASQSITAIPPGASEDFCATPATLSSKIKTVWRYLSGLLNTSDFTLGKIESIIFSGEEEVFDIQVEGTENFIANGLVSHNTRWALNDLTGRLTKDMVMNEDADQYEIVEFPAVLEGEETDAEGNITITQRSLWPEQWPLEALLRTKASMPLYQWNAQYQQNPTSEEGAIVKREWWRIWDSEYPPACDFIIQSWDTAFEKHNRADYSACTTWGVWWPEKDPHDNPTGSAHVILLNAFRDRMEFPELKKTAMEHYQSWHTESTPVSLIVEKKATGAPLIYEMRATGVPVQEYTPSKGQDKIARLNSVSDLFASGVVWAPRTRWAEEVIDEVASFPSGDHDDYVDATTLALMRFRQGGFVRLESDWRDEAKKFKSVRREGYY